MTAVARTVLLISRGTMSGGSMIAECLSSHGGIRCLTREDLLATVNTYGEVATRIASQIPLAEQQYEEFSGIRRPYVILMRRALLEHVRAGRLAYFGYSGHLLLPRMRHCVRIRLIATMEVRVARTQEILGYSPAEAREYIRRVDQERTHWARMVYGLDIRDPAEYDICINIERLSQAGTCALLRQLMEEPDFQATPESLEQFEREYLATQVLAALVTDPATEGLELGASVSENTLRVVGPHLAESERRLVLSVAAAVPGVPEVVYEPGYAPAFSCA
ncbi:MAG TPA: cytidylate kinase-like family protein [Bryobacteraceae bacterium]|nr:cytidylate kinase-like family protein [Bryobacteraceae bacterium]